MAILDFLKNFRSTVDTLKKDVAAAQRELELALRRREDLQNLPQTKEELLEILRAQVHADAERYPALLRQSMDKLVRERNPLTGLPHPGYGLDKAEILTIGEIGKRPSLADIQVCLAYFLKDDLLAGIARAIDVMPEWKAGPPNAERVEELGRLDQKIAELEERLREIAANATEAGIHIGTLNPPKKEGDGRKLVSSLGAVYRDKGIK